MSLFSKFRRITSFFSGKGLREKIPLVNKIYTSLNKHLAPKKVKVFDHIMLLDDQDSMELALNGIYGPTETDLIRKLVKSGDIVVDVGANIGYFTLIFAQLVGEHGKVLAFEPDNKLFRILEANIQNNGYKNVTLFRKGLSDQNTSAILYLDKYNNLDNRIYASSSAAEEVEIQLVKLDDFISEYTSHVDLIKIDIQGAEGLAFRGMQNVIRTNPKIKIVTEFWPWSLKQAGTEPDEFIRFLSNEGFSFYDIDYSLDIPVSIAWLMEKYPPSQNTWTNLFCFRF
jgi:FkbM family methyltransferase